MVDDLLPDVHVERGHVDPGKEAAVDVRADGEFRQEGEWFIMDKMNRRCPELSIRNGVTNDEHIIVGDKDYALAELMPLEKELHLYVAPLWKAYWMKKEIRS